MMKNYFSQLAKQSGLRISEPSLKSPAIADNSRNKIKPLHEEKTILVSPAEKKIQPLVTPGENTAREILPERENFYKKTNSSKEKSADKEKPGEILQTENSGAFEILPPPVEHIAENRQPAERFFSPDEQSVEINSRMEKIEDKPKKNPATIDWEILDNENEDTDSTSTRMPESSSEETTVQLSKEIETPPEIIEKTNQRTVEKASGKYFEKTGRILEDGEVSKQEAERTIFEEVQQWVAGAQSLAPIPENQPSQPETTVKIISVPPENAESFEEIPKNETAQISVLEEQNLSLSIGNISIRIDGGEEVSPKPEMLSPRNPAAAGERKSERQFSRLSRYYL